MTTLNSFPFAVEFVDGAQYGSPEQMYQLRADFDQPHLSAYKALFDQYGATQGLLSLVDVTLLIIEGSNYPDLVDHMDFDEEAYALDMHVDSPEALRQFAAIVCPAYQDLEQLRRYVRNVAAR
ncbi:immunity 51 family protein [Hymenobacter sp. 15J16-1T3B]|uniref:immunity 51 family protein n=1 Tax=Hymenobacter sp. 15J16-1T3B TaxID=2886941 RepID=UPI001D129BAC|nr:immunity 51 family protein [Hymenobacter sp. 15J16-1T3B]MCC3158956.1 immunity 51 family protein [Hymenobacter sp. 15J16-1T3B]